MKKLITMLLCGMLGLSMVACSDAPSEEVAEEQTSKEEVQEKEFSLGKMDGLVYENDFVGMGCTLPSDWAFLDDEQIMELNDYTEDVAGEEYEEAMKDANLIYDMYAISSNQLDNINVILEKKDNTEIETMDLDGSFKATVPMLKESFTNMGYAQIESEVSTINVAGKEFPAIITSAEMDGVTMYQKIFAIKCDGYLANITVTTYGEDTVDSLLSEFYFME